MQNIELIWSDIFHISDLHKVPVDSGFYLWLLKSNEGYIPFYVGKSSNIQKRLGQHLAYLLGGLYDIYHKDKLLDFARFKEKRSKVDLVYHQNTISDVNLFYKNQEAIRPHLASMYDNYFFSFSTYEHSISEIPKNQAMSDIEKSIIKKIGIGNLSNVSGGDTKYFSVTHKTSPLLSKYLCL